MNRLFRTLLLWLMIAVLPLHAVASVVGMPCANMHTTAPASVAEHHGDAVGASHHHAAPVDQHDADAHVADDEGSHSSCSACSAFCAAPAVPVTAHIAVPDYDGSEMQLAMPPAPATGFIPEGPRRPPRALSV